MKKLHIPVVAGVSAKTRLLLARTLARSRSGSRPAHEPLAHIRARMAGWSAFTVHVPVSSLRRAAIYVDPWWSRKNVEKNEKEPEGDALKAATRFDGSIIISVEKFPVTLLDGKKAEHVRRVIKRPTGQRIKEFAMQVGETSYSIAELARFLPLFGIDRFDPEKADEIILAEGVAAANALIGMKFAAAGTLTGALHTPQALALEPLKHFKKIYLWPDNDSIGVQHMQRIAQRLHTLGARNMHVIRWSGPHHGDAADFQGGPKGVKELMAKAVPWTMHAASQSRGQLGIRLPRIPVTLLPPDGMRSPDDRVELVAKLSAGIASPVDKGRG